MSRKSYAPALAGAPSSTKLVKHKLESLDENNEEYEASTFGGFTDYMRRKKIKLQNQDALIRSRAPEDTPAIFQGMTIHINGYTKPGRVELWNAIVTYGGVYKQYLEGKTDVTHIVASNLTKKKQEEFAKYRIVRPEWIMDSITAGRALPWTDPQYRVIDAGRNQKTLNLSQSGGIGFGTTDVSRSYKRVSGAVEQASEAQSTHEDDDALLTGSIAQDRGIKSTIRPQGLVQTHTTVKSSAPEPPATDSTTIVTKAVDSPRIATDEQTSMPAPKITIPPAAEKVAQNRMATKTAKDPDFIQDYFRNSRLHHLSTWKANLRLKIDNLSRAAQPLRLPNHGKRRYIMHIDFDCFFAAVSSLKRPDVAGKPCAVTHGGSNSGEIASCNYKAREYGIKNGMWMKEAVKLCSEIISLPYEFEAYENASDHFYNTLLGLRANAIEAVSIDEALLDISNLLSDTEDRASITAEAESFAVKLRTTIRDKSGVEVSLGIGGNVLQAKLATKKAKPAGHYFLHPDDVITFMNEFEVASLPGVGHSTSKRLEESLDITSILQLREISQTRLQEIFGPKTGITLSRASNGLDDTVVGEIAQRKLVSIEINWGIRLDTPAEVSDYIRRVSEELARKLKDVGFASAQHLLVKVMRRAKTAPLDPPKFLGHGICDKFNAGRQIPTTGDSAVIWKHALALLESLNIPPNELRGIGVALTKLQTAGDNAGQAQRSMSTFMHSENAEQAGAKQSKNIPVGNSMPPPAILKRGQGQAVRFADSRQSANKEISTLVGTQFVVPSQIDATVLAELPVAIQEKIAASKSRDNVRMQDDTVSVYEVPRVSQIDPADLAALPASVRHEILLHNRPPNDSSPRRNRNTTLNSYITKTPSPKKIKKPIVLQTLTQVNFVERPVARNLTATLQKVGQELILSSSPSAHIDREVLAGLPDDIRKEVLNEDRNRRWNQRKKEERLTLASKSGPTEVLKARRTIELPVESSGLQFGDLAQESIQSLRRYLSTWYKDELESGPQSEDMQDFEGYLKVLIVNDRDLERVEALLRWLWLLVQRHGESFVWIQRVRELIEETNRVMVEQNLGELQIL
ncbi:putative DNA damage repair protein Mus42 [Taphrina deformans PYCC 5710]|uniref:DNA repair protein REV1 n=1 Tax=Taphrina deformans (strain PYCC 5710 / ATCC 11124 / CBS 356.35 / IMI 108563 / JCM 9778 / NBRC 8474) TaxID=1097556 RepID=R4XCQ9_TAPDE|nr:putative DNA damage repair protein Mus42 [Taphrina deformans PYCC 5710]|eukprot:CCG83408.1 putative DNA damage repair protein Mus42 [Taphrina deformans PYCC 5710]